MPNEPVVVGAITFDELANPPENPQVSLSGEDFTSSGDLKTTAAAVALVVQSAAQAKAFITNKQYALLWR